MFRIISLCSMVILAFGLLCMPKAAGQAAPLTMGSSTTPSSITCPTDLGFYLGNASHTTHCYTAQITCPDSDAITVTYGRTNEAGAGGTIVLFSGAGGTTAVAYPGAEASYAQDYVNDGYQVVQLAWAADWENTNSAATPHPKISNVKTAACRPATFLKYVHDHFLHNASIDPTCAQGSSAGSAAIAYSLAWYGAADYLDKVELTNGPVFSDIDRGCKVTGTHDNVTVCPSGQTGCVGWGSGVSVWVQYRQGADLEMQQWTGDTTCAGPNNTSGSSSTNWKAMSIDDGTSNWVKTYPNTHMSAWLCKSVSSGAMNNSSPEGQLYYSVLTPGSREFVVTAISGCDGPEGIFTGTDPNGSSGHDAIHQDMTQTSLTKCQKLH
jgi:hypothetical protein